MPQIVPMKELRNTNEISELCHAKQEPIFVTKNGYGRLVVMDIEFFEKTMNKLYEATALAKGIEDENNGNTRSGEDVIQEMRLKYGL